jgi:CRP-like cAMP-binding protein
VFARGSAANGMHLLATGHLVLTILAPQGTEHVLELIQAGDTFGEAAVLTKRPHPVTATAVTACDILHIDRKSLTTEIERDGNFAQTMIALLGEKLYRQSIALENLLFLRATGRVARFVLDCLTAMGAENARCVTLPARKGLIASQLNMTQEHFSRTLRELMTSGLIKVNGTIVDVIEFEKLRDMAGLMVAPGYAEASAHI